MNLDTRIAALNPQQRQLFDRRLCAKRIQRALASARSVRTESLQYPVSYGQERLFQLQRNFPDYGGANMPVRCRLKEQVAAAALEDAINDVVTRHEVLRTCFATGATGGIQKVIPKIELPLTVVDLSALPPTARALAEQAIAASEAKPFDLGQVPLLRCTLLCTERNQALTLTLHHIVFDGPSLSILMRELALNYRGILCGESAKHRPLPLQYRDFAIAQREVLSSGILSAVRRYGELLFSGAWFLGSSSHDGRSPVDIPSWSSRVTSIRNSTMQDSKNLSQRYAVTILVTLLSAFHAVLAQWTGRPRVVVGTITNCRYRPEMADLIGLCVNTLACRVEMDDDPPFEALLMRVQDAFAEALTCQDLPFEIIAEQTCLPRDATGSPLLPALIILPQQSEARFPEAHMLAECNWSDSDQVLHNASPLCLWMQLDGTVRVKFRRDVFSDAEIECLMISFDSLLRSASAHPERRLSVIYADAGISHRS